MLHTVVQILKCIIIADFLTGLVHWLEDRYGKPTHRFVGKSVVLPNLVHHFRPRHMTKHSWWQSADTLVYGALFVADMALLLGLFSWQLALVLVLLCNANEIHKWAHRTKKENGPLITLLQKLRLVQTPAHHNRHHKGAKDKYYCSLTNFVNPALEFTRFFKIIEKLIAVLWQRHPRNDADFKDWVKDY